MHLTYIIVIIQRLCPACTSWLMLLVLCSCKSFLFQQILIAKSLCLWNTVKIHAIPRLALCYRLWWKEKQEFKVNHGRNKMITKWSHLKRSELPITSCFLCESQLSWKFDNAFSTSDTSPFSITSSWTSSRSLPVANVFCSTFLDTTVEIFSSFCLDSFPEVACWSCLSSSLTWNEDELCLKS